MYLGDCIEILPTLPRVDLVITDPPYSSGGFQEAGKSAGSVGTRTEDTIWMDNLSSRGYSRLIVRVLKAIRTADEFYAFTDWKMWQATCDCFEDAGIRVRNMLVWDKQQMGMGMPWRNQHELICYGRRRNSARLSGAYGNVLKANRSGNENHPTEKPTSLIEVILKNATEGVVVDPFAGSGSTGVACMAAGRKFIGIEIEPKYFDVACERLDNAQRQEQLFA
jgi:DNA modification methylase